MKLRARLESWLLVVVLACPLLLVLVSPYGINVTYDWGMVRCIYGFALGVLCWQVWQHRARQLRLSYANWTLIEIVLLAGVSVFVTAFATNPINVLGPPMFAVAVLVFAHAGGAVSRALAKPFWLMLGTLSYSIYLTHTFVQARMGNAIVIIQKVTGIPLTVPNPHGIEGTTLIGANAVQGTILLALMLVVVVVTSWFTYRLIERPAQRWSRQILANRAASTH